MEELKTGTRWQHKSYPNSFELIVLGTKDRITYVTTRDDGSERIASVQGPFVDVVFLHGKRSTVRSETIQSFFKEVAA